LPPRAPELNSQENIWQFVRQNWLSNRIFKSFNAVRGARSHPMLGTLIPSASRLRPPEGAAHAPTTTRKQGSALSTTYY
jgi:hypothetical protein